jgi:hypothetical protein
VSSKRPSRPGRANRRQQQARNAMAILKDSELESAIAWLVHDSKAGDLDSIAARSARITEDIRIQYDTSDEINGVVLEMVTGAIAIDCHLASLLPEDHVTDERLTAKLREINAGLMNARVKSRVG